MTLLAAEARPPRPPRPASVTVAFWLQFAAAAVLLIVLGLAVANAVYFDGQISRAVELVPEADPDEVNAERVGNIVSSVVTGGVLVATAAFLAATAVPALRGSNVARILVFVAAGAHILLCATPCVAGAAAAPIFLAAVPEEEPPEGVYAGEDFWQESRFIETLYTQTSPVEDGFFLGMTAGSGLEVLLVIAVVILLAVPPANRYFVPRPPAPTWPGGYAPPAAAGWPMAAPWPGTPAVPHPGLPYVICPDPSAHVPPPDTRARKDPDPPDTAPPAA
ncbi:hypothetical protein [Phytohabitans suffuscus]|uniref:Uncharacterized protein n=1 Tax=Phytohabitans suffuscus TaxID=624315 RepID=A0A6F8YA17_9ACTN|nr:hypothetical protein [Phytohabitans suffuscus]BCB82974.1 hypothetical protein Psuf_002870 [Phytohabitans suffuscus]